MVDLSNTIIAKSDQLNADDLMGGPITVQITAVRGMNDKEQPIAISFDGDGGKPYKPGKSMRRVLVNFWGKQGDDYVGRWLTLFRDPDVSFGGIKVGGIRISHMSHIGGKSEMALAVTRGAKRLFQVEELRPPQANGNGGQRQRKTPEEQVEAYVSAINAIESLDALREYQTEPRRAAWIEGLKEANPKLHEKVTEANSRRAGELLPPLDDDEDGEGETEEAGEGDGDGFPDDLDDDRDGGPIE